MLVWDNHGCMPLRADAFFLPRLEEYRRNGVNIVSLNVGFGAMDFNEHLELLHFFRQWISERPEHYQLVTTTQDVRHCQEDGRLGVLFDVEGMNPVVDDVSRVGLLYDLGVRWMLIAYNRNNPAGGGCLDTDLGLTATGRRIIDEMERVGMVLCVSHCGERTAIEAIEYARKPPIFSHSNLDSLHAHPRNISNRLVLECAKRGGVVGISGIAKFLGELGGVAQLLRHILNALDLVGSDHVGLGLDYVFDHDELKALKSAHSHLFSTDELNAPAVGPSDVRRIADGLALAGISDNDIAKVMGTNWLRIAEQCWSDSRSGLPL